MRPDLLRTIAPRSRAVALCALLAGCGTGNGGTSPDDDAPLDTSANDVAAFDAGDDAEVVPTDVDAADTVAPDVVADTQDAPVDVDTERDTDTDTDTDTADVDAGDAEITDAEPDTVVDAADADADAHDTDTDTDADVATDTTDAVDADAELADITLPTIEPPPRESIDWLAQDFVPGTPGTDPYCHPAEREEARIDTALAYLRTDAADDEGGISVLAPAYNPERQRWESRALTTFDFRPYAEAQAGLEGIPNGADVFEAEGRYVSIVGTNDSAGVAGWASSWGDGCQFFDGWISYDRFDLPDFDPGDRETWAGVSSPIEGVRNPTRDGCPDAFGSTYTRWTYVRDFAFAAADTCDGGSGPKVMDTIVSDHDGGNHHEVFYFTDEYGAKSRWERWECGIPYPDHDYITDRCRYDEAQSVMHMAYGVDDDRRRIVNPSGATCYMTDCRDFTTVEPLPAPGYVGAAWHHGAVVYYSGNILRNGDFHRGQDGWDALGTTADVVTADDGNHHLRVSAPDTGWQSVLGTSIDQFNRLFDGDGAEAHLPKYLHWGARIRHSGDGGTARMAVVEWGNPGGEVIDERPLAPESNWQHVAFHRLLGAATNTIDIRFRLDGLDALEIDDVYAYVSNDPER